METLKCLICSVFANYYFFIEGGHVIFHLPIGGINGFDYVQKATAAAKGLKHTSLVGKIQQSSFVTQRAPSLLG